MSDRFEKHVAFRTFDFRFLMGSASERATHATGRHFSGSPIRVIRACGSFPLTTRRSRWQKSSSWQPLCPRLRTRRRPPHSPDLCRDRFLRALLGPRGPRPGRPRGRFLALQALWCRQLRALCFRLSRARQSVTQSRRSQEAQLVRCQDQLRVRGLGRGLNRGGRGGREGGPRAGRGARRVPAAPAEAPTAATTVVGILATRLQRGEHECWRAELLSVEKRSVKAEHAYHKSTCAAPPPYSYLAYLEWCQRSERSSTRIGTTRCDVETKMGPLTKRRWSSRWGSPSTPCFRCAPGPAPDALSSVAAGSLAL